MDKTYFFITNEEIKTTQEDDEMTGTQTKAKTPIPPYITAERDADGKFIPLSEDVIREALAQVREIPRKENRPLNRQSVLTTALEASRSADHISLEEMGL